MRLRSRLVSLLGFLSVAVHLIAYADRQIRLTSSIEASFALPTVPKITKLGVFGYRYRKAFLIGAKETGLTFPAMTKVTKLCIFR